MKKSYLHTAFLLSLFFVTIFTLQSFSQSFDWNVGTGGNSARNGLSKALGPFVESGSEPELYWSGGESTPYASYPLIEGDNLIVARRWPSNNQEEAWIINYNVYTGEEKWKVNIPVNTYYNHAQVSGVKDGLVFANRSGGSSEPEYLYALDIETGEIVWMSEDTYGEHATETVAFNANGDIVTADIYKLLCIDHTDGSTIWELPRNGGSSDGSSISVFGDKGYYWEQNSMGMFVSVCNLETGEYLYSTDLLGSPGFQQGGLMVGIDGTVYAPFMRGNVEMDSLHALSDKGDHFEQKWSYPLPYITMGNYGVGPDGTVYSYSPNEEVIRLDPETGEVLNTSIVVSDGNGFLTCQMAIGDDGLVYLAAQDWPFHKLFIFTQELELLWGEEIQGLRGVALGDSVLAINGKNDIIRAYKGRFNPISNIDIIKSNENIIVFPNPSSGIFNINTNLNLENKDANIEIINISGQVVYSAKISSGFNTSIKVDISDQKDGIYLLRCIAGNEYYIRKIVKQ